MDKYTVNMGDLDDLCFRLECGIRMADAVHDAMTSGPNAVENYTDALYGACLYLDSIRGEFRNCIDNCFATFKDEKGGRTA